MTTQARIIIDGGGIVGVSTPCQLAKADEKDALLFVARELMAGAAWHVAGNLHILSALANLSALQACSECPYDSLAAEAGSHVAGGFLLAQTKERMEGFKHLASKFRHLGLK
ncbi:MAG: hypothetical protein ACOH2H_13370 [Cypionkella sp.]